MLGDAMSINTSSPGILGGGGGAPTGDQVWEGLGDALADDPTRITELNATLALTLMEQVTLTAWTEGTATGGASVSQGTSPSRLSFAVPASAAGAQSVTRTDLLPGASQWDVAVRVQVLTGDGSAQTRVRLVAGVGASDNVTLEIDTNGSAISYRVASSSATDISTTTGPTSGQRTGGQLWLRIRGSDSGYRTLWGVGSAGALPTSWTVAQSRSSDAAAAVTWGVHCQVLVGTLDTSVSSGLTVDVLDVQAARSL
jgi:hypothetical protein